MFTMKEIDVCGPPTIHVETVPNLRNASSGPRNAHGRITDFGGAVCRVDVNPDPTSWRRRRNRKSAIDIPEEWIRDSRPQWRPHGYPPGIEDYTRHVLINK